MKKILFFLFILISFFTCSRKQFVEYKATKDKNNIIESIDKKNEKIARELNDFSIDIIDEFDGLFSNNIISISKEDELLWICTSKGISIFDTSSGKIENKSFTNGNLKQFILYRDKIYFFADSGVYISTNSSVSEITNINFRPEFVYLSSSDILLNSTDGELYNFNMKKIKFKKVYTNLKNIYNIFGNQDILFIGVNNKLISITEETTNIILNNYNYKYKVYYFNDDYLYLAYDSLIRIDLKNYKKEIIITLNTNEVITTITKDNNIFYIGKNNGLLFYNITTKMHTQLLNGYKVKNSFITFILPSDNNTLFLGTKNNGVIKYMFNLSRLTLR